jgi:hypothetical protein
MLVLWLKIVQQVTAFGFQLMAPVVQHLWSRAFWH